MSHFLRSFSVSFSFLPNLKIQIALSSPFSRGVRIHKMSDLGSHPCMDLDGNLADPTNGLQRGSANELRERCY